MDIRLNSCVHGVYLTDSHPLLLCIEESYQTEFYKTFWLPSYFFQIGHHGNITLFGKQSHDKRPVIARVTTGHSKGTEIWESM